MDDAILRTRLVELRDTLERAKLPQFQSGLTDSDWRARIYTDLNLSLIPDNVWIYLDDSIGAAAADLENKVNDLIKELESQDDAGQAMEPNEPWERFRSLDQESQALFSEFVELAGGLAFRDRSNDPWIFLAADRLVQEYRVLTRDRSDLLTPLTLPRVQDPFTKTLTRIIRLRFPDWTIWALPLTAYEFAYVWLGGRDLPASGRPRRIREDIMKQLGRELGQRDVVLMSDAFAVAMLGPAYAFAALHLRYQEYDLDRAHVILRVLELLGRAAPDRQEGLYDAEAVAPLRKRWQRSMLYRRELEVKQTTDLESFAELALRAFRRNAETALHARQAWGRVRLLRNYWENEVKTLQDPDLSEYQQAGSLSVRDVLNAVWLAHSGEFVGDDIIVRAGETLCRRICSPARQEPSRLPPTPPAHRPQRD